MFVLHAGAATADLAAGGVAFDSRAGPAGGCWSRSLPTS